VGDVRLSHRLDRGAWLVLTPRSCSRCRTGEHSDIHPRTWYLEDGPRRTYVGRSIADGRQQLSPLREHQAAELHLVKDDPAVAAIARAGSRAAHLVTLNRDDLIAESLAPDELLALSPTTSARLLAGDLMILIALPTRGHDQRELNQLVREIATDHRTEESVGAGYVLRSRIPRSRECPVRLGRHLLDERLVVVSAPASPDLVAALQALNVQQVADRIQATRAARRRDRDLDRSSRQVVLTSPLVVLFGEGADDVRIADADYGSSLVILRPGLRPNDAHRVPATVIRRMQTFTA
jgi:hypothetical protein